MSMQFWISLAVSTALNGCPSYTATDAMMISGVTFATNMARTCCRPNGMALLIGTLPSSLYTFLILTLVSLSLFFPSFMNTSLPTLRGDANVSLLVIL